MLETENFETILCSMSRYFNGIGKVSIHIDGIKAELPELIPFHTDGNKMIQVQMHVIVSGHRYDGSKIRVTIYHIQSKARFPAELRSNMAMTACSCWAKKEWSKNNQRLQIALIEQFALVV